MLTVITPTRNRPIPFALLERWMAKQTFDEDIQWIVVNDGSTEYKYTSGQFVLRRKTKEGEIHSLNANLLFALPHVKYDKIAIIEDDDWIGPRYLEFLSNSLNSVNLAGSAPAIYYNLARRQCRVMNNRRHASLGQTGFRSRLIDNFRAIASIGNPSIDLKLWSEYQGSKVIFENAKQHVSLKSLPGEAGIGVGHRLKGGCPDPQLKILKSLVGVTDLDILKNIFDKFKI